MFKIDCKKFCLYNLLALIFISCANPRPPSGGPPDKTPPKIIEFFPQNRSLNFKGSEIFIKFNKWVDRNSVINNIFLNPPIIYKVEWNGKKMHIQFAESLPKETTISFLLGTNYSDLDGNQPNEPFYLVFSTGNNIDSGRINGRVVAGIMQNIYVYAIPITELNDTLFDVNSCFHYRTQPDNLGNFKFEALKADNYIIFSYNDKNKNKVFDFGQEDYGFASDTIHISTTLSDSVILILSPPIDEIPPFITNAMGLNPYIAILTFSESIVVSQKIFTNSIEFIDTSTNSFFTPLFIQVNIDKPNELILYFQDSLREGIYKIVVSNPKLITDTAGNPVYVDKNQVIRITKTNINLPFGIFEKSVQLKTPSDSVLVTFSHPLDTTKSQLNFKAINIAQKDTFEVNYQFLQLNKLYVKIPNLKWKDNYKLLIHSKLIYDYTGFMYANNSYEVFVKVADEPRLGSIQGTLLARIDTTLGNPMLMLYSPTNKYYTKVVNNLWKFENVLEGEYQLIAFYDENNNKTYDSGRYRPLQLSERLIKFPMKITIMKGWSVEEIKF
ncbi:MAG: Ig-like domain-containing protein [Candidatus Kapaibacteriota bacterium]